MSTFKPCIFRKGPCRQVETFYKLFGSYETIIHMQGQSQKVGLECHSSEYCGSHNLWLYIVGNVLLKQNIRKLGPNWIHQLVEASSQYDKVVDLILGQDPYKKQPMNS